MQELLLHDNRIATIEDRVFHGLAELKTLRLDLNRLTRLNLTGATFVALEPCHWETAFSPTPSGFCVDHGITDLVLDDAVLSEGAFHAIVKPVSSVSYASLIGLRFSDAGPESLSRLLTHPKLSNVRVDHYLYRRFAAEFNDFAAVSGRSLTVLPEPQMLPWVWMIAILRISDKVRRLNSDRRQPVP